MELEGLDEHFDEEACKKYSVWILLAIKNYIVLCCAALYSLSAMRYLVVILILDANWLVHKSILQEDMFSRWTFQIMQKSQLLRKKP